MVQLQQHQQTDTHHLHPRFATGRLEKERYERVLSECGPGNPLACQLVSALRDLSWARDQQLQEACSSGPSQKCKNLTDFAIGMGNNVRRDGNFIWANSPDVSFGLNISTIGPTPDIAQNPYLTNSWHHSQARSLSQGVLLGTLVAAPGGAQTAAARLAQGADTALRTTINAIRAETQLIQSGYYRYAAPTTTSGAIWVSNPANIQNTIDFVQALFPGSPPTPRAGIMGGVVGTFVLPADWYK